MSLASHVLLDRFNNHLTGTDQWTKKQIQDFAETITTWDSAECDDDTALEWLGLPCETGSAYGSRHHGDRLVAAQMLVLAGAYVEAGVIVPLKLCAPDVTDPEYARRARERSRARPRQGRTR